MKVIDGSVHEGGGSILRVAAPLALASGEPVHLINVRANRKKPGLRLQHMLVLQLLTSFTGGQLQGCSLGSTEVKIIPSSSHVNSKVLSIDTAASVPLIIQSVINFVAAGGHGVKISFRGGGTHTRWAPTMEYLSEVTAKSLRPFGIDVSIELEKVGFFPKGGAMGTFSVSRSGGRSPVVIRDPPEREVPHAISVVSRKLERSRVGERIVKEFVSLTGGTGEVIYLDSPPGAAVTAVARGQVPYGSSAVGERGVSSEQLARTVAREVAGYTQEALDPYLSDQLIVPFLFSPVGGQLMIHETPHSLANLDVVGSLFPERVSVEKEGRYLLLTR